jgi:hypothetical protein
VLQVIVIVFLLSSRVVRSTYPVATCIDAHSRPNPSTRMSWRHLKYRYSSYVLGYGHRRNGRNEYSMTIPPLDWLRWRQQAGAILVPSAPVAFMKTNGWSRSLSRTNGWSRSYSRTNGRFHSYSRTNGRFHSYSRTNGCFHSYSRTNGCIHSYSRTKGWSRNSHIKGSRMWLRHQNDAIESNQSFHSLEDDIIRMNNQIKSNRINQTSFDLFVMTSSEWTESIVRKNILYDVTPSTFRTMRRMDHTPYTILLHRSSYGTFHSFWWRHLNLSPMIRFPVNQCDTSCCGSATTANQKTQKM